MSKEVWIDLPLSDRRGEREFCVEARIVDVAPHLPGATWAVHKNALGVGGAFVVSNIETGACIGGSPARTQFAAVVLAREFLASITPALLQRRLAKVMKIQASYVPPRKWWEQAA